MDKKTLEMWRKERDRAVASLDVQTFRKFYKRWQDRKVYEEPLPDNDMVVAIVMCKMATNINSMPDDIVIKAKAWLKRKGYSEKI